MKVELLGYLTNEGNIITKEELEEGTIQSFPLVSVPVDAEMVYKCKGCVPEVYKNDCNFWWNYKENRWQESFHNVKQSNPDFYKIIWRNNMQEHKTYTSAIGKLYQNKHKQIAEDAWVDALVSNILEDLEYCIEVEGQELPIPATLPKSRINTNMSQEDSDKVLHALKIKGVIAKRSNGLIDDCFVVEDFL